jgi:hypothetical protein
MNIPIRVAASFDEFLASRPGLRFRLEQTRQRAPKYFGPSARDAEMLVEAFEMSEQLRREVALKYGHAGENDGSGVQAAMPEDGMQESDRPETPDAKVLLGCVPAERRPRDAKGGAA